MGKYDPLHRFLESAPADVTELTLSFQQIEQLLGEALPYTARHQGSWWANEVRSGTRPQSSAWLDAGWEVDVVEREQGWVQFGRIS
jgi:hypothetical protein